ncbi:putative Bifunctional protein FolD [Blattamonas nauphoetae]|uniref:Bifunctional protein FolD n=1 Tax=Blattamonas nauphoetae TaxID=2049346 RepID=A0ABQ9YHW8_9EUKA|nr:putative Bifunctional protein FolD [Blattamonas nauphoetae]
MADKVFFKVPKVLLPKPEFRSKWATVACDQFTSEPEYWESAKKEVGDKPSMLNIVLPELYLDTPGEEEMIVNIVKTMKDYCDRGIFDETEALVYLERKTRHAERRRGLICALDLEAYSYSNDPSPIRPTEMTIVERIPPRLRVRSKALIESPHILVLIDDPERRVIEPITAAKEKMEKLYDEELMLGAGHITGYKVPSDMTQTIISELTRLSDPTRFAQKYGVDAGTPTLLYAVGDGNHSLATAKKSWDDIKATFTPEEREKQMKIHPARYCLIELNNIFDEGIEFEPIHRVLFDIKKPLIDSLKKAYPNKITTEAFPSLAALKVQVEKRALTSKDVHHFGYVGSNEFLLVGMPAGEHTLPVGAIQSFLDSPEYKSEYAKIDYIHGDDVVLSLIDQDPKKNCGIVLPMMAKDSLFTTVIKNGRLPRKTFSMGEADEKRFYFECRKIVP